ncbi:hypothetical protein OUZ56_029587 [Daphnia magna]|uniref:Uncharacterized protein n=1 Tax=Daphnia magna TaxID=35525 RepID=A0ABR0B785_9CRUS|nr:hypothetical protein OUZ56_029587 [Daphnia magna]
MGPYGVAEVSAVNKGANGFNKLKFSSTVLNRGPRSTDPEPNRSAQHDISEATVEATCSVNFVHDGVESVPENISTEAVNQIIANEPTSNFGFHSGDSANTPSPNAEIEAVIDQIMSVTTDSASSNFSFMRLLSDYWVSKNIHHINRTGSRISCFAHVLDLAVQSFLKAANTELSATAEGFDLELEDDAEFVNEDMVASKNIIRKLRRLVNSIKSSGQRRELFEASCEDVNVDQLQLIIDCPTRWNSTCTLMKRALKMKQDYKTTSEAMGNTR